MDLSISVDELTPLRGDRDEYSFLIEWGNQDEL